MTLEFKKKKEDFICEHCGHNMDGDGYTNHCSLCFYSKHVDNFPGDRGAECGGLMKPVSLEKRKGEYAITHQCLLCGEEKRNKVQKGDNFEALISVLQ